MGTRRLTLRNVSTSTEGQTAVTSLSTPLFVSSVLPHLVLTHPANLANPTAEDPGFVSNGKLLCDLRLTIGSSSDRIATQKHLSFVVTPIHLLPLSNI